MIPFDIETKPRHDAKDYAPEFEAPKNYKDPEKIIEYIKSAEARWIEKSALSSLTGEICAIGYKLDKVVCITGDEKAMLEQFVDVVQSEVRSQNPLVGFNSRKFDVPYIVQRCFANGIKPPKLIYDREHAYQCHIDLMEVWQCLDRQQSISLNNLACLLGAGSKYDLKGKLFYEVYSTSPETALEYLQRDVELVEYCAEKML